MSGRGARQNVAGGAQDGQVVERGVELGAGLGSDARQVMDLEGREPPAAGQLGAEVARAAWADPGVARDEEVPVGFRPLPPLCEARPSLTLLLRGGTEAAERVGEALAISTRDEGGQRPFAQP
jgi:hypothetical protein